MSRLFRPLLLLLAALPLSAGGVRGASDGDILQWTSRQMKIAENYSLPPIHRVSREVLGAALREHSRASFLRWQQDYGPDQAEKFMQTYAAGIAGLFDAQQMVVYVGDFLPPCRQEAVVAHELTHYLQQQTRGLVGEGAHSADLVMVRELVAQRVERRYRDERCTARVP